MKISAAMMVRNEEQNLPRCLESIRGFVDEIAVVDTGSTDRTVEILDGEREAGTEVLIKVSPWRDDFSFHRNESLDLATGDWLLVIDADEELCGDKEALRKMLESKEVQDQESAAILVKNMYRGKEGEQQVSPRLFLKGKARYYGIVHNYADTEKPPMGLQGAFIRHYGYDLDPEAKALKHERTVSLLKKRLEQNPYDWQAHFYMAEMESQAGHHEQCVYHAEKYLRARQQNNKFNPSVYYLLSCTLIRLKDFERAAEVIQEASRLIPHDLDMAKTMMDFGLLRKNPSLVSEGARRYVLNYDRYTQDLTARGGRFCFNYDQKTLCFAMFNLMCICLSDGQSLLNRLVTTLEEMDDPEYKDKLMRDIQREMTVIGMNFQIEEREAA